MNVVDFIFRLFHIVNFPFFVVLIPPSLPCTPSDDYAQSSTKTINSSTDCDHTFVKYTNFSTDYANKFDDCVNTLDDQANIVVDSVDTPNKSFSNLCIPNPSLLQLLLIDLLVICRSKINIMLTIRSSIYFVLCICGFCISQSSNSSFISKLFA